MKLSIRCFAQSASCPFLPVQELKNKDDQVKSFDDIPGPKKVPFIGSFDNLQFVLKSDSKTIENYPNYLFNLYKKYGSVVKENLGYGRQYVVHIFDPSDAQTILGADGKMPMIVPLQETTKKYRQMKGMNPGLGNLNGPEWYRLRSAVQHAMMRPQSVQTYLPFSQKVSSKLIDHIKKEQQQHGFVDMEKVAGRWALESSGQVLFEKSLGSFEKNMNWADELVELNKKIFKLSAKLRLGLPIFRIFPTPSWKNMVELEDQFYGEVDRLMDNALDNLKIGDQMTNINMRFASYLINQKQLDRRDIKVILLSMFSDGLSTTAPMLIYNLFNLAKHPSYQNECRKEINQNLSKLPFLRSCLKETFRMFPIGTEISRITQKDLILSGFNVPAGTPVDINTNILMRSSILFSDSPNQFKPSRWLENSKNTHPFAFLPFGFGPRMCAGRRFAEQDLLTVLSEIVKTFEIKHEGQEITQIYETLLLPKGNCKFVFKKL